MHCKHSALFNSAHLEWDHYHVEVLIEKLTGGLPSSEALIGPWMASRSAAALTPARVVEMTGEPIDRGAAQAARVLELDAEEIEKSHTVVFARIAGMAAYEGRCFAGALKEAANILKATEGAKTGIPVKNFRSKVVERVFVCERYATFPLDQVQLEERPISVMTRQGPRTSLKRCEVAHDVSVAFTLHVMADGIVKPTYLEAMVNYCCLNGFGADRSQGSGRAELVDFVRL